MNMKAVVLGTGVINASSQQELNIYSGLMVLPYQKLSMYTMPGALTPVLSSLVERAG